MKKLTSWSAGITIGTYAGGILCGIAVSFYQKLHLSVHAVQDPASSIVAHNFSVQLLMLVGILTFGLLTIVALFANSAALGVVMGSLFQQHQLRIFLLAVAPHGILEIGALLLIGWADMQATFLLLLWLFADKDQRKWKSVRPILFKLLVRNVCGVTLLTIAGLIEATITPHIIQALF